MEPADRRQGVLRRGRIRNKPPLAAAAESCRFACELCSLGFRLKSELRSHWRSHHQEEQTVAACRLCGSNSAAGEFVCHNCENNVPTATTNHNLSKTQSAVEHNLSSAEVTVKDETAAMLAGSSAAEAAEVGQRRWKCGVCGKFYAWHNKFLQHKGSRCCLFITHVCVSVSNIGYSTISR
jgi:ribosomal protein L37AE/L43A